MDILRGTDLVHGDHFGSHGTDQHDHPLGLGAAVQDIRAHSQFVLGHAQVAAPQLRTLIHHPHGASLRIGISIRHLPDQVADQCGFSAAGRGDDQRMAYLPVFCNVWNHLVRTAGHLMSHPDIDRRYVLQIFHPVLLQNCLSYHTHTMSSFNRNKSLPYLLLIGIEGIMAHILQGFPHFLPGHDMPPFPVPLDRRQYPLLIVVCHDQRLCDPHPDLLDLSEIQARILHHSPHGPRQDAQYLPFLSVHIHLVHLF